MKESVNELDTLLSTKDVKKLKKNTMLYEKMLLDYLETNGLTDYSTKVLAKIFSLSKSTLFFNFLKMNKKLSFNFIENLFSSEVFATTNSPILLKYSLSLFIDYVNSNEVEPQILKFLVQNFNYSVQNISSSNKKDLNKYIYNCLILQLKLKKISLNLSKLGLKSKEISLFRDTLLNEIKNMKLNKKDLDKVEIIKDWLNNNSMKLEDSELTKDKDSKEANSKNKQSKNSNKKETTSKKKSKKTTKDITIGEKDNSAKLTTEEAIVKKESQNSTDDSKKPEEQSKEKKKTKTKAEEYKKELEQLKIKFDKLTEEFDSKKQDYVTLSEEHKNKLEELKNIKDLLLEANNKNIKLQEEVAKRDTVLKVFDADAESKQEGILKHIATKLKAEYIDFQSALDLEMTIDLGENMRAQLETVFKILKKNGIVIGE